MAIIVLLALVLVNTSCTPAAEGGFLRALDSPAEMKITGERNGVAFSAELTVGEKGDDGMRDGGMLFTSPAPLEGIEVSTAGGVWNSSLGGVEIAGISAALLGAPLVAFTCVGEAVSAEKLADSEGRTRTLIVTRSGAGTVEYLIDSKSGIPLSVTEKDADGAVVMKYHISEYKNIS